jgi:hypothetical protein
MRGVGDAGTDRGIETISRPRNRRGLKRAPTEVDAPLDNEGTATTYSIGDGLPAVTGSPCGTGEAPALNPPSGASPYARIVGQKAALTLRLKKGRGPAPTFWPRLEPVSDPYLFGDSGGVPGYTVDSDP